MSFKIFIVFLSHNKFGAIVVFKKTSFDSKWKREKWRVYEVEKEHFSAQYYFFIFSNRY